jgi:hypothetical protein
MNAPIGCAMEGVMKSIINGLRYDTEKAVLIGKASYGYSGDFQRWEAGLYRTPRSGRFFLAGSGGAMTQWSQKIDNNSWTGGSGIKPMNTDDAREWAERYLSAAEVEAGFAEAIQDA